MMHPIPQRGAILIIVMVISLGLVTIALYFGQSAKFEYRAAENGMGGIQAEQAIEGIRRYVKYILVTEAENLATDPGKFGQMPSIEDRIYEAAELPIGDSTAWLIGRPVGLPENYDQPVFALRDERARINLNTATLEMLQLLPNMTYELAASIIDWRDADDELSPDGAEDQDYFMLDPPYLCKNAPFESVAELNLVMGATRELLYGEDTNMNGILDPNENDGGESYPPDNGDGRLDAGLFEYVTVWSKEPETGSAGSARINVTDNNSRQQLQELLAAQLGEERAQDIIGSLQGQIRSVLEFYIRSGMTTDEFMMIEGDLTHLGGNTPDRMINVATAPWQVLRCIPVPEMEEGLARNLVSYRANVPEQDLHSVSWVSQAINQESAIAIGPYLTGRTFQLTLDVAAVGRMGRGFRRSMMVIDTSTPAEPRVIYRRDLTHAGWPLGQAVFDTIYTDTEG